MLPKGVKAIYRRLIGRQTDADVIKRDFDAAWYLQKNQDVAKLRSDPIKHFLSHGWSEGRWPRPDFDPSWYRDTYQDVAASGENPFVHFVRHGRAEGRKTVGDVALPRSPVDDQAWGGPGSVMAFDPRLASAHGRVQLRLTRAFAARAV